MTTPERVIRKSAVGASLDPSGALMDVVMNSELGPHLVRKGLYDLAVPTMGGAGLGAMVAPGLGVPKWLGALLGGGAGFMGRDYINNTVGNLGVGAYNVGRAVQKSQKNASAEIPASDSRRWDAFWSGGGTPSLLVAKLNDIYSGSSPL